MEVGAEVTKERAARTRNTTTVREIANSILNRALSMLSERRIIGFILVPVAAKMRYFCSISTLYRLM